MSKIAVLPIDIANKIAAGEIIERPVSVVKELLENSIDAKATSITLDIEQGGRFIRITDNGDGIEPDELLLAFRRFATSKLKSEEELWQLTTLGFRGEALASIASVSNVEMCSRTEEHEIGRKIVIGGGELISEDECGCSKGTTIKVSDLFFNTPARLKFLKSPQTEIGLIEEFVSFYAIACPNIAFRLFKNTKKVLQTLGNLDTLDVIRLIYGKDFSSSLFHFKRSSNIGIIEGFLSYPNYCRADKSRQLFFVNKRVVRVPMFNKIVEDLYRGLLPEKNYPGVILFLTIDPSSVDVNVHPTKKEVRFRSNYEIQHFVKTAVNEEIQTALIQNVKEQSITVVSGPYFQIGQHNRLVKEDMRERITPVQNKYLSQTTLPTFVKEEKNVFTKEPLFTDDKGNEQGDLFSTDVPDIFSTDYKIIGQLWNTYIILVNDKEICLVDQHIAHERYIYDKLEHDGVQSQALLIPCTLKLSFLDIGIVNDNSELFNEYGFDWDEINEDTIVIRAVPHILIENSIEKFFLQILTDLKENNVSTSIENKKEEFKKSLSCHAAIKAGEYLVPLQMEELIKHWISTTQPDFCPHGRPITFKLNRREINKKFER